MRPAKRARIQLRRNWNGAITVQCVLLAADILLAVLELGALLLMGLGVEQGISIDGLLQGRDNGWRLAILLLALLIDLFLTSPLRAGQAAYYRLVADPGPPPLRPVSEVTDEAGTRLGGARSCRADGSPPRHLAFLSRKMVRQSHPLAALSLGTACVLEPALFRTGGAGARIRRLAAPGRKRLCF